KYLPNYLAWQRLMSWNKEGVSADEVIASALGKQVINV
ncbi:IS1595 family transposase, partial [Cupriavidus sp. CV2]|nr:IS1595 family transposase [Cupriavidus sp. CV2]MDW3688450.1 IS1595 family transposase [Cupriavidus sp. CV2]